MPIPIDFGDRVPGASGLASTGTGQSDAYQLTQKVSVFSAVASGTGAVLPSSYASGTGLRVLNRGANNLLIYPAPGDQIEAYGVDQPVEVIPGGASEFISFDAPLWPSPRTWWLA